MLLFPAIDLMDGQVVRLEQGRADRKTVYSSDPPAAALRWQRSGGHWLHLVDLDGAFTGQPRNLDAVRAICQAVSIPCELGGGIRDLPTARAALDAGVSRVVVGTRAAESSAFVRELVDALGPDKVAVGIDARNGLVSVKGWTEASARTAADLAADLLAVGARTFIYTDIATDGMLQGPNLPETESFLRLLSAHGDGARLIASGGVSSATDVRRLAALPGLHGAIIGKALYDGHLTLEELAEI